MKIPAKLAAFEDSSILDSLSPAEMNKIASAMEELVLPKHHLLFDAGEPANAIFFIHKGSLRITAASPDGKSVVILALMGPGDVVGDAAWESEGHDCRAETVEESIIYQIKCSDLLEIIKENPNFALALIRLTGIRLKQAQTRIEDLVFRQVPGRIARLFVNLAENHGRMTPSGIVLDLPLTHQEIADMVGSSRVTVTQVLNKFRLNRWIGMKSKRVTIRDVEALEGLVNSNGGQRKRSGRHRGVIHESNGRQHAL